MQRRFAQSPPYVSRSRRAAPSAALVLFTAGLAGCSGADAPVPETVGSSEEATAVLQQPPRIIVQAPPPETVGHQICDLLNSLPAISAGAININKPTCSYTEYDNLYYLGSIPVYHFFGAPSQRPAAMSDALFCALKDSDGGTADGTVSTALGRFGIQSRIHVSTADPGARKVVAQRIGSLVAFGAVLGDIENQDLVATFPSEQTPFTTFGPPALGRYLDLQTSITTWNIGGSGSDGPIVVSLQLGQNGFFQSMNNNGFSFLTNVNGAGFVAELMGQAVPNVANPAFSWATMMATCAACVGTFCSCPNENTAAHNEFAGWSDANYAVLTDGILPYGGPAGGVSGNYVYPETSLNWSQFGLASGGTTPDDPKHVLQAQNDSSATSYLTIAVGLDFGFIKVGVGMDLGVRSGMELTQGDHYENELKNHYADVATTLDSESRADLTAHLVITNPFPFGPSDLLDETFNLINPLDTPNQGTHVAVASMSYDYVSGFPFAHYTTPSGAAVSAEAAHDACMAMAPVDNPVIAPTNPEGVVQSFGTLARANLYPCNVVLCNLPSAGATTGTLQTCVWNAAIQNLVCTNTAQTCTACSTSADLCDSSGDVYHGAVSSIGGCAIK